MSDDEPKAGSSYMELELRRLGPVAKARHARSRRYVPDIKLTEEAWCSPYDGEDCEYWWALFFQMLGTRMGSFVDMVFEQLLELIPDKFVGGNRVPDVHRMRAVLGILQGMDVRNEAQCAYALQLVSLHLSTMKLGEASAKTWGGDPRSVAVMAKATRAFGDGLTNLQRLQGKAKKSSQTIKVEKHEHYHQHVHFEGEGGQTGGQPQATRGAALIEGSATMSGTNAGGEVVRLPSRPGQASLPDARGKGRRAKG